jgi:hypothetical protein
MAREFQRSLDQYAKEAELDEVKKGVDKLNVRKSIQNTIDPKGAIKKELTETDKALRDTAKAPSPPKKSNGAATEVDPTTPEPKQVEAAPAAEPEPIVEADQGGDEPRKAQAGGAR